VPRLPCLADRNCSFFSLVARNRFHRFSTSSKPVFPTQSPISLVPPKVLRLCSIMRLKAPDLVDGQKKEIASFDISFIVVSSPAHDHSFRYSELRGQ